MTAKVVRIIMILLTVFIASIVLPDFYKTSFRRNVKYVSLNYSEVTKQFVIWGLKDGVLLDTLGNEYSRQEYERMVPFSSMPQLLKRNEFPDTVAGNGPCGVRMENMPCCIMPRRRYGIS